MLCIRLSKKCSNLKKYETMQLCLNKFLPLATQGDQSYKSISMQNGKGQRPIKTMKIQHHHQTAQAQFWCQNQGVLSLFGRHIWPPCHQASSLSQKTKSPTPTHTLVNDSTMQSINTNQYFTYFVCRKIFTVSNDIQIMLKIVVKSSWTERIP